MVRIEPPWELFYIFESNLLYVRHLFLLTLTRMESKFI